MPSELLHLYGPFSIQSYGVMILLGIVVFMWLALDNPLRVQYLTKDQFFNFVSASILVGIIGGRALHVLMDWSEYDSILDMLKVWEGGFSILGTMIAVTLWLPWYTRHHGIRMLPILDLAGLYGPLVQSISRLGCFFAGCCYGAETTAWWGVTAHPGIPGLENQLVHPTQLYSAALLFLVFLILRFVVFPQTQGKGFIMCWYLILAGSERFIVDFWRADRILLPIVPWISWYQLIAAGVMAAGCSGMLFLMLYYARRRPS